MDKSKIIIYMEDSLAIWYQEEVEEIDFTNSFIYSLV